MAQLAVLGQETVRGAAVPVSPLRGVALSRQEGEMIVRVVESIVAFAKDFPLEFHAYCPMKRWEEVLKRTGEGTAQIESQLASGRDSIIVSADTLFATMDLEECASGARDARLSSAKTALIISAAGAVGETLLGLSWLGLPAYIISLAIVLGRPLVAMAKEFPAEPFRVDSMSGSGCRPALGDHTDKAKVIERVIVSPGTETERHHWGSVIPGRSGIMSATCLSKGKFRVRVEGWTDDRVTVSEGWYRAPLSSCMTARNEIAVWAPADRSPRDTGFPPVPDDSGHEETFWAEYVGPLTKGALRKAGPFG